MGTAPEPEFAGNLELAGRSLYVEIYGPEDGPPVVLLHHGLGSSYSWQAQIPDLSAAGFRTVVYDRWGYGRSGSRPALGAPAFEADLEHLDRLLEKLDLEQVSLVGHSDGGTIGLYFAARSPQRVVRLVTVAAHIYVEARMEPGIRGVKEAFDTQPRFRQGLRRLHGKKVEQVFYNWYDGWLQPGIQEWDMRPWLARIQCPTLVVQGIDDEHATPQHARDIAAAIPQAQLWLVPDAGHMLAQEQAEIFNARLRSFLLEGVGEKE